MFTLPLACSFLVLDNYQHLFLLFILLFAFTFLKYVLCTFSAIFIPPGWLVYVDLLLSFSHFCSLSLSHTQFSSPHILIIATLKCLIK